MPLLFTSVQLGDGDGGAGEHEGALRGGEAGREGLLLLLGENLLLVCRLVPLFPDLLRPGTDLCDCLAWDLSVFLEFLRLGDLDQDILVSLPFVLLMVPLLLGEGAGDLDGDLLLLGDGAGAGDGDLAAVGGLDLFLLGGLLLTDLSLFWLISLTGLWSAEAFLAPVLGWSLLCTDLCLVVDAGPGPVQRCLLG